MSGPRSERDRATFARWPTLLALSIAACETGLSSNGTDAGLDAGLHRRVREAGPLPEVSPIFCEGAACSTATESPLGELSCCLETGLCGLSTRLFSTPSCLEPYQPGGVSLECEELTPPGVPALQGCCTALGSCGIYDRFGGFGCIPAEQFGSVAAPCEPDPMECRKLVDIPCDGPEDCASGEVCCGRLQSDLYDRFGCFPSCDTISDAQGGVWFQICHADTDCRKSTDHCSTSPALPPFLGRCYSTGEAASTAAPTAGVVACGEVLCELGEKCCFREPGTPYCLPLDVSCTCSARSSRDAGVDASNG